MGKWKRNYRGTRTSSNTPFLDTLTKKKVPNINMRILSHFLESEKVKQSELIKELFDKVETDPERLFIQKLALKIQIWSIRRNYNIFIRAFSDNETYCKILTTKEEFEEVFEKLDDRRASIEAHRT